MYRKKETLIALILTVVAFSLGLGYGLIKGLTMETSKGNPIEFLRELAKFYHPYDFKTAIFIFTKNLIAVIFMWLIGFIFSIPALIGIAYNAFIIGYVIASSPNILFSIMAIVPHGILEIPALIIAGTAGVKLGIILIRKIFAIIKHTEYKLLPNAGETLHLMKISISLLAPAAIIETFITPLIASLFK